MTKTFRIVLSCCISCKLKTLRWQNLIRILWWHKTCNTEISFMHDSNFHPWTARVPIVLSGKTLPRLRTSLSKSDPNLKDAKYMPTLLQRTPKRVYSAQFFTIWYALTNPPKDSCGIYLPVDNQKSVWVFRGVGIGALTPEQGHVDRPFPVPDKLGLSNLDGQLFK